MAALTKKPIAISIDERPIHAVLREFPKIGNQELNKAYRKSIQDYAKKFAREKLGRGGVFHVRRKWSRRSAPRGQPRLPAKVVFAGFKASLAGQQRLNGKRIRLHTSNPLLTIREKGGTIRPKRGEWLYIKAGKFRGRGASEKAAAFETHVRAKLNAGKDARLQLGRGKLRPIVARVRSVHVPANLGFLRGWRGFQPTVRKILNKAVTETVRRAEIKKEREIAKLKAKGVAGLGNLGRAIVA